MYKIQDAFGNYFLHQYGGVEREVRLQKIEEILQGPVSKNNVDNLLKSLNDLLDGYGIESIQGDWVSCYWQCTNALYVNLGDTYVVTVVYDTAKNKLFVSSWGSYVEANRTKIKAR